MTDFSIYYTKQTGGTGPNPLSDSSVHVKDSAMTEKSLCLLGGNLTWTTPTSAREICTCSECLSDVLQRTCSMCNGSGKVSNGGCSDVSCCGPDHDCHSCGLDAAEDIIANRRLKKKQETP